jgi:hypothetical protein
MNLTWQICRRCHELKQNCECGNIDHVGDCPCMACEEDRKGKEDERE